MTNNKNDNELIEQEMSTPMSGGGECPHHQGNRFWLENMTDTTPAITFSINSASTPNLPQTSETHTLLPNTLRDSKGSLRLNINGQSCEVLPNIDTRLMDKPEDLCGALIIGKPRSNPVESISNQDFGIPFTSEVETVDLSEFLPKGVTENNTDIDLVMILEGADSPNAIKKTGPRKVNDLNLQEAEWVLQSLLLNTLTNTTDGARITLSNVRKAFDVRTLSQMKQAIKEIAGTKMYIKPIAYWGGKTAIIFKGLNKGRAFLTSAIYGLRNKKMSFVSSYAEIADDALKKNFASGMGKATRGLVRNNFIGFIIAGVVETHEFIKSEDPEKNWGDLLGGLSVQFVKVWAAGFVGVLAAAGLVAIAAAAGVALPVFLVITIGISAAIGAGFFLDWLDNKYGVSEKARKMGRSLGSELVNAAEATTAFVDRMVFQPVDDLIDSWVYDWKSAFINNLRYNDPQGYNASLFCSDPKERKKAFMIELERFLGY